MLRDTKCVPFMGLRKNLGRKSSKWWIINPDRGRKLWLGFSLKIRHDLTMPLSFEWSLAEKKIRLLKSHFVTSKLSGTPL